MIQTKCNHVIFREKRENCGITIAYQELDKLRDSKFAKISFRGALKLFGTITSGRDVVMVIARLVLLSCELRINNCHFSCLKHAILYYLRYLTHYKGYFKGKLADCEKTVPS